MAKPDTILAWYRKLIAQKFDGSQYRRYPGRPRIEPKLEALIVQMAKENSGWGYDRIAGALANLGYTVSDETVGNVLKRNGIDFFTVEVLTWRGLVTYYILYYFPLPNLFVSKFLKTQYKNTLQLRS